MTEIAVCQRALGMVGVTTQLSGTTVAGLGTGDNTAEQQVVAWYQPTLDALLRSAPWGFATMGVTLTQDEVAGTQTWAEQWSFTYTYPAACYAVIGILNRGRLAPAVKFKVGLNDSGDKVIFCDLDATAVTGATVSALIVTTDATDVTLWDADFGLAVSAALAANLVMPLKSDAALQGQLMAVANRIVGAAWKASGLESEPDGNQPCRYEYARWGYRETDG